MELNLIAKYFILFIIYSFAGWILETLWVSWCNKKFVDRGFLIGPYCPIYGCGALVILIFLRYFSYSPLLLFTVITLVCGVLEYMASWIMEKVFKARWWDYSDKKVNLNGRICLDNLLAFGVMGLVLTYLINPNLEICINYLSDKQLRIISFILWTIFIMDFVVSTIVVYGFRKVTEKVNRESATDNTEQITKMVRESLSQRSFFHRRFIDAYPKLEAIKIKMQKIKNKIEDVTTVAKDTVIEKVNDAKDTVIEKVNDAKDVVKDKVIDAKDIVIEKVNGSKEVMTEKTVEIKNSIENGTIKAKEKINNGKINIKQKLNGKK